MQKKKLAALLALPIALVGAVSPAYADDVKNNVANNANTAKQVTVGAATDVTYTLAATKETGDPNGQPDCNASAASPVTVLVSVSGVTVTPSTTISFTACGQAGAKTLSFSPTTAGEHPVSHSVTQGADISVVGANFIVEGLPPATVPPVEPINTAPVVTVQGVEDGETYEAGAVPAATCSVVDAEDTGETATAVLSPLTNNIGEQTATCSYTDTGSPALSGSDSVTYTVEDTLAPTVTPSVSGGVLNDTSGWYTTAPQATFTCADSGSGVATCTDGPFTFADGPSSTVEGSGTDHAGNTGAATAGPLKVDTVAPTLAVTGGPVDGASYFFGEVPAAPTCTAVDGTSGPGACTVTGGGSTVGEQSYTLTALDVAGNTTTETIDYTVKNYVTKGFYSPVDMGGVVNTVKGGSTVPLKFELFGSQELTSTSAITGFAATKYSCTSGVAEDGIESTSTGGTTLRYDTTGGQFIQNWQTPKTAGVCYKATMTLADGGSISALFKLK